MNRESDDPAPAAPRGQLVNQERRGAVVWLTGLSGSGKTTLSRALERAFLQAGCHACSLDGDRLRRGLSADLGFSWAERSEHVRRVAEVATLMSGAGLIAIAALISPGAEDRRRARSIAGAAGQVFFEVYLDVPLEVCEARDPKRLYCRARAGELPNFTGISSPYEAPVHPELTVHPHREELGVMVERVTALLRARALLPQG